VLIRPFSNAVYRGRLDGKAAWHHGSGATDPSAVAPFTLAALNGSVGCTYALAIVAAIGGLGLFALLGVARWEGQPGETGPYSRIDGPPNGACLQVAKILDFLAGLTRLFRLYCSRDILSRVATSVWVILLLLLFSVGMGGHGIAMASGEIPGELPAITSLHTQHHHAADGCSGDCQTGQGCCFMGQCLLAMLPPELSVFLPRTATAHTKERTLVLYSSAPNNPYRPPAAV
jgi:hypothetical protein